MRRLIIGGLSIVCLLLGMSPLVEAGEAIQQKKVRLLVEESGIVEEEAWLESSATHHYLRIQLAKDQFVPVIAQNEEALHFWEENGYLLIQLVNEDPFQLYLEDRIVPIHWEEVTSTSQTVLPPPLLKKNSPREREPSVSIPKQVEPLPSTPVKEPPKPLISTAVPELAFDRSEDEAEEAITTSSVLPTVHQPPSTETSFWPLVGLVGLSLVSGYGFWRHIQRLRREQREKNRLME